MIPRRLPDHRYLSIKNTIEKNGIFKSEHPDEISLYQLLARETCELEYIYDAYDIYRHEDNKHILNALILAKGTTEQICSHLAMSMSLISAYRHLFFDNSIFRHDLAIKNYVETLELDDRKQLYYTLGCEKGFKTLAKKFRIGEPESINPKEALNELLGDQLDRARSHRGFALTHAITKEAFKWSQLATNTANNLVRQDLNKSIDALAQLKLALVTVDNTVSVAELNVAPDNICH